MKNTYLLIPLGVLLLLGVVGLPCTAQNAAAQEKPSTPLPPELQLNFTITLGSQFRDLTNLKSSKFQLGREVPRGFFLRDFFFDAERPGRPYYFSLSGKEAGERDQRYRLVFERFGKFRTELRFDQFPRFDADNTQTLFVSAGNGVYVIPDLMQGQLEVATDATLPGLVRGVLAATPLGRMRLQRERWDLRQEFMPSQHWRLRFGLVNEIRSGDRPVGWGAYIRTESPSGSLFLNPGIELPEPVNYRTTEIAAGASYERERGFLGFEYRASWFRNRTDTLTFDNPFRLTDAEATSGGSLGRFRFARAQIDLVPDNTAHTLSLLGGYSFPHNTRLTGALSFSFWRQNDPFLPWTLNTAVVTGVPAGVRPTDASTLPQPSLNGQVTTHSQDWALTSRLTDTVRVAVRYRLYDYDNNSDEIRFPGFVGRGDGFWRSTVGGLPIENELFAFFRQRSGSEVAWQPRKSFSWKNEFVWEGWNREHRAIGRTNEWMWKSQVIWKPKKWLYTKANYRYGDRIPRGLYRPGLELAQLRQFDQQQRIRHNAELLFQLNPDDKFNFSGSYAYRSDRYDEHFFGLATYLQGFFTVDANYLPSDRVALYANFTRERYRSTYLALARHAVINVANSWVRDTNNRVDSLGAGFAANGLDTKLNWDLNYAFALSRVRIRTNNPFTVPASTILNAQAFPFPNIEDDFHEVRTTLRYLVRHNVELGVRYLFEPRFLEDFTWDLMSPYISGFEPPENDFRRYLFLDARDSSYHGHAAGIFLLYTF